MRWMLGCLVLLVLPAVAEAALEPERMDPGDVIVESGGAHLPLGPGVTQAQAIAAAYALPEVQAALTHMGALGYVAHPMWDDAGIDVSFPATFVALSFEKPGLIPPSFDVIGAPMVLVGTVPTPHGPRTSVTGGLAFFDTTQRTFWTADSLPAQYPNDLSWEVVPAGSGDPGDGTQRVSPGMNRYVGPYAFTFGGTSSPEDQKFRGFMHCAAMGAGTAALNTIWQGPPIPQRIVIQGAIRAAIAVAACGVGTYGAGSS